VSLAVINSIDPYLQLVSLAYVHPRRPPQARLVGGRWRRELAGSADAETCSREIPVRAPGARQVTLRVHAHGVPAFVRLFPAANRPQSIAFHHPARGGVVAISRAERGFKKLGCKLSNSRTSPDSKNSQPPSNMHGNSKL
jgi:hypothetical protein